MIKITSLALAGALLVYGLSAAPAASLATQTWVSGHGMDSGACTLALPCRTFAFALAQTAAGGEIDVLDPADYSAVTITKAIDIVHDGAGVAAIGASSGNGITINAGASDSVHLRGLTIEGLGTGTSGILFNMGGNLAIENCVIRNFTNPGIYISASTSSRFSVSNTIVSNNNIGILVEPTAAAVVAGVLSNVKANNNNSGIGVVGTSTTGASLKITIADSVASSNGSIGIGAFSSAGHAATAVMVRNSVAGYNNTGLSVGGGGGMIAVLRVAHSVVTGNNTGVSAFSGGTLFSYGDNDINGNTNDNLGALTTIPTH